jgi:arsenical pump membrane protein
MRTPVRDALLIAILAVTVALLYVRPYGLRDWQIAAAGGLAAWPVGPLSARDGLEVAWENRGIIAFFLGLMLLAAAAEAANLYPALARMIGARSIMPLLLIGTVITVVLSNDATPLVLTPAVFAIASVSGAARERAFAVTFTADCASLVLPVSNPDNLLFYERLDIPFGEYARQVTLPGVAGAAAMGLVVWWRAPRLAMDGDRTQTQGTLWSGNPRLGPVSIPHPRSAMPDSGFGRFALGGFAILSVLVVVGASIGWSLGAITVTAGVVLAGCGVLSGATSLQGVRGQVSPGLFVFVLGLLLLVESVAAAGLLDGIAGALDDMAAWPAFPAILVGALMAAALSNVVNNWPAALALSATLAATGDPAPELVAGALIGCTIGANYTMLGSLSTVFWMSLARPRGLEVDAWEYARAAALPTTAAMLAACSIAALLV